MKSLTIKCPALQEGCAGELGMAPGPLYKLGLSSSAGSGFCLGFGPDVIWPLAEHLENKMQPLVPLGLVLSGAGWEKLDWPAVAHALHAVPQTMLLEKLRVARRPANEATFNVFYYLLACGDGSLR